MTTKPGKTAQVCRQKLINLIGAERYELWFTSDHSISVSGKKLIVAAENEFSSECQRKNFRTELLAIARHQIGANAEVVFCVKNYPAPSSSQIAQPDDSDNSSESNPKTREKSLPSGNTDELARNSVEKPSSGADGSTGKSCYNLSGRQADQAQRPSTADSRHRLRLRTDNDNSNVPPSNVPSRQSTTVSNAKAASDTTTTDDRRRVPRFESLESFVIDSRNKVAAVSASQVVQHLGEMSPFFLCGPTGCGKTHLLEGIYQATRQRTRPGRVMYMTSAQYTTQFLDHLNNRTMPMFRQRFHDLDVFLLDDIQFFHNKRATIVELVQLVDQLTRRGSQLVFAADRNLSEMSFLGTELITRISSGLVSRIDYPGSDGRCRIVRQAADRSGLDFDDNVAELIAERIAGDLRHIRGAMNRLQVYHRATGEKITVERTRRWLADIFQTASRVPTLGEIEDAVCSMFGLEEQSLQSNQKVRSIAQPRMLAMWLSRKYTRAALSEIGDYFGGRSHSTVLSARKKVTNWVEDGRQVQTRNGELAVEDVIQHIETKLHVG